MEALGRAILAAAALLAVAGASAGPNGSVQVGITLTRAPGACVSGSASGARLALVQVACPSGEFVAITAAARRGRLDREEISYRYSLAAAETAWMQGDPSLLQWGTVTALRIVDLDRQRLPVEMLVSF